MKELQKTIYFTEELLNEIGECKSLSKRVNELIKEGLLYEKCKDNKISIEQALGYFNKQYKKKYPNNDLPVLK